MTATSTEAGPELDAQVAAEVMGAVVDGGRSSIDPMGEDCWIDTPKFSTDWAAAGEVMEKLKEHGVELAYCPSSKEWDCSFTDTPRSEHLCFHAATAPLAICLAALAAVRLRES